MATIARAKRSDFAAIDELARLLHAADVAPLTPARQASRTFVAKTGGRVRGFVICTLTDYGISRSGQLEELAVAEDEQGGGLGGALVAACEDWLKREGAEVLFISALEGATGFYERLGYKPCVGPWLFRSLLDLGA